MNNNLSWHGNSGYISGLHTGEAPISFGPGAGTSLSERFPYNDGDDDRGRFSSSVPPPFYRDSRLSSPEAENVSSSSSYSEQASVKNLFPPILAELKSMNIQPDRLEFHNGEHLATTPRTTPLYKKLREKMIKYGDAKIIDTLELKGGSSDIAILTTASSSKNNTDSRFGTLPIKGISKERIDVQTIMTIDPNKGGKLEDGGIFSPMTLARHELQHSYDYRLVALGELSGNDLNAPNGCYGTVLEARAVAAENAFAAARGESGKRLSHPDGAVPLTTKGFTSTEPDDQGDSGPFRYPGPMSWQPGPSGYPGGMP